MAQNKSYRLISPEPRHRAIAELAKQRGFKSVPEYLHWLIDRDSQEHGFEMPPASTWGGKREVEKVQPGSYRLFVGKRATGHCGNPDCRGLR